MNSSQTACGRVLVVDDHVGLLEYMQSALETEGYEVATAADGQQALQQIEKSPPDVVLLDLAMPVMTGWEFQQSLRERGIAIPVVFMSAGHYARDEAAAHQADGFLAKPFDLDRLLETVARFTPPRTP